jgi:F0F1-type ATP synthase membrane subunit b/b'
MISEILDYYFDKKVEDFSKNLVTQRMLKDSLVKKADIDVMQAYQKRISQDWQSVEDRFREMDQRLHTINTKINAHSEKIASIEADVNDRATLS